MTDRLAGKVALITGGASGLGECSAILMAREGARVVINGRSDAKGARTLAELDAGERGTFIAGDVQTIRQAGVVEKCTFCYHRTSNGLQPACVEVCPSQARIFGDQEDATSEIAKVLKAQKSFRLQEDKGTKPNVHYVGKYSARG